MTKEHIEEFTELNPDQLNQFLESIVRGVDSGNGFSYRTHTIKISSKKAGIGAIEVTGLSLAKDTKAVNKLRDLLGKNVRKMHFFFPDTAEGKCTWVVITTTPQKRNNVWGGYKTTPPKEGFYQGNFFEPSRKKIDKNI